MRNLKRALSLTLASVMLLGMMVVGASAKGYPDVDEEDNVEAIEVLQAIEVMRGDDNGNFNPDSPVTRSEMAVVMALLLKLDYQYYEATCPFWDVPTWARPYVGACYANKIVSGYSANTYGAADGVTPVQAASMMMRALGYFQYSEDYADGFETATVRQGSQIGIFDGVGSSATAQMTRNQVAKMALNALQSEMVTFTGTTGTTYTATSGETLSIGYRAEYTPRTSTEIKYTAIEDRTSDVASDANHKGQYYIQLGEELYNGKLTRKYDTDEFERPSINWQYDGKEIGTYVNYDLLVLNGTFTTKVTGAELYELLTYTTIRDNDLLTFVDGVASNVKKDDLVRSNKNGVNSSGTGVLTEVFVDDSRDEIIITSINTYLAKANSDYNKTNETLSLKVYTDRNGTVTSTTKIVDSAIVPEAENVAKDDYCLVYMSGKDNANNYEVVRMYDTEIIPEASITKWALSTAQVVGDFTANGTEYKTNVKGFYDGGNVLDEYGVELLTDMSYNIYLDRYGNAIGVDLAEGTKNYVFITGYDRLGSNIAVRTADAAAIFLDGTMDVITVNVTDTNKNIEKSKNGQFEKWQNWNDNSYGQNGRRSENRWYTYTVSSNGVYTLKPVERFFWTNYPDLDNGVVTEKVLNTANLFVDDSKTAPSTYVNQGRAYGNDNSVYITVEVDAVDTSTVNQVTYVNAITDVQGVYTGAQNVKLELNKTDKQNLGDLAENNAAYVYSIYDSNYYIIASVVLGDAQGAAANYAYILGDAKNERIEYASSADRANGDATYYWEFDAVVNGEKTTLTAKTKYSSVFSGLEKFHVQELRFDGDYVTKIVDVKPEKVMTEIDEPLTDKMDVYDMGHVIAAYATNMKTDTGNEPSTHDDSQYAHSSHRIDGTIELVGRSLYTERVKGGSNTYDVGLALTTDAKAVLIQYENNERVVTNCSSVSEAVGRLADAEPNETLNPGTQFRGRIVAVLNSAGAAEWVVVISDTPVNSSNPNYGNSSYYLDLYDDLANNNYDNNYPATVTASNRKGDDRIISGYIYRDENGMVCTRYPIPAGYNTVVVQDRDINASFVDNYSFSPAGMNEVINLANATLTIPAMSADVRISNIANAFDQAASVTVTGAAEGVTVAPSTGLKVGDRFTVTLKAGYTYTVNGGAVQTASGTYTVDRTVMTVNVTKTSNPGAVTVNVADDISAEAVWDVLSPDGTALDIDNLKPGDKFVLDPGYVLKATGNVTSTTEDGKTVYTIGDTATAVNIEKDNGSRWMVGMWWANDATGKLRPLMDILDQLGGVAALARAAYPNWYALAKQGTQFEITVTVNGKSAVWLLGKDDVGLYIIPSEKSDATLTDAELSTSLDMLDTEANYDMKPVEGETPADPAELEAVVISADGKTYTLNYYTEANRPTETQVKNIITQEEANAKTITKKTSATAGYDYTYTVEYDPEDNKAAIDINVKLVANSKVMYGEANNVIAYIPRGASTDVAGFKAGDIVISGDNKDIKVGPALKAVKSGDNYVISVASSKTQDDVYLFDALTASSNETASIASYVDKNGNNQPWTAGYAVKIGAELNVQGTKTAAGTYQLRSNGVAIEGKTATLTGGRAATYTVQVAKSMADKNGNVFFSESDATVTVRVHSQAGQNDYPAVIGEYINFTGTKNAVYLIGAKTGSTVTASTNNDGKLNWQVIGTPDEDGIIHLYEAYVIGSATFSVMNRNGNLVIVDDVKDYAGNDTDKMTAVAKGEDYVAYGANVCLTVNETFTSLRSANGKVTLNRLPAKDTAEGNMAYYFAMPAVDGAVTDIVDGTTLDINVVIPNDLNTTDGTGSLTVYVENRSTGYKLTPSVLSWWKDQACTEPATWPAGLATVTEKDITDNGTTGNQTIAFKTVSGQLVENGTWYLKVSVDGVEKVSGFTIAAPVATSDNIQTLLNDSNIKEIVVSSDLSDAAFTIPAGKIVTITGSGTTSGTVTVNGKLIAETAMTNTVVLNSGATLEIGGSVDALPTTLTINGNANVILNSSKKVTGVYGGGSAMDISKPSNYSGTITNGKILTVSESGANVSKVALSGKGNTDFNNTTPLETYLAKQFNSETMTLYWFSFGADVMPNGSTTKVTVHEDAEAQTEGVLLDPTTGVPGSASGQDFAIGIGNKVAALRFTVDDGSGNTTSFVVKIK